MTQLILMLSLNPIAMPAPATPIDDCTRVKNCTAQVEICVYPRKCSGQRAVADVPVQTCVWPHTCAQEGRLPMTAQFQPCVWPNRCAQEKPVQVLAQFQPCVWPNRCSKETEPLI